MQEIINFVCEKSNNKVSGGYIYNDYLLAGLQEKGYAINYYDTNNIAEMDANADTYSSSSYTIIDSISVNDCAAKLLTHMPNKNIILLCHLPPEMQVKFENDSSHSQESPTSHLIRSAFVVFTGTSCEEYMKPIYSLEATQCRIIKPGLIKGWQSKNSFPVLPRKLLVAASLIPNKGYELLLATLQKLKNLPWQLDIYGESKFSTEYANNIFGLIKEYQLEDRISYKGAVDQLTLNRAMIEADLMIHLSAYEPYSMISLEAINANLPLLSSVSGEHAEFARSGSVKYIENYDVESCTSALTKLLTIPSEYAKLCQSTEYNIRTWQNVTDDFEALLKYISIIEDTKEAIG